MPQRLCLQDDVPGRCLAASVVAFLPDNPTVQLKVVERSDHGAERQVGHLNQTEAAREDSDRPWFVVVDKGQESEFRACAGNGLHKHPLIPFELPARVGLASVAWALQAAGGARRSGRGQSGSAPGAFDSDRPDEPEEPGLGGKGELYGFGGERTCARPRESVYF